MFEGVGVGWGMIGWEVTVRFFGEGREGFASAMRCGSCFIGSDDSGLETALMQLHVAFGSLGTNRFRMGFLDRCPIPLFTSVRDGYVCE